MTTGRTVSKYIRKYVDGYDMSGYTSAIGPLSWTYEEALDKPQSAELVGSWLNQASMSPGTLNGIFDNTATSGIHAVMNAPASRIVSVAWGIQAAPAAGDPVYCGKFLQTGYDAVNGPLVTATVPFGMTTNSAPNYGIPWGRLLHTNTAATAAYTGGGVDWGAENAGTAFGGYMVYHVTTAAGTGNITATIKVQDSVDDTDGNYGDLLSSGEINCGSSGTAVPTSGIVALAVTASVKRWTRWQLALNSATSVTFVLSFVRAYHA